MLLPPLHINLILMNQFIALPKYGEDFKYLCEQLSHISEAKLKKMVFVGSDVREMMSNSNFEATMTTKEEEVRYHLKKS